MKKITLLKSLLVVMALSLFSFSAVAETITIDFKDNSLSLPVGSDAMSETEMTFSVDGIEFGYKSVYYNTQKYAMFSKSKGVIYNKTSLGTINSISVTYTSGTSEKAKMNVSYGASVLNERKTSGYVEQLDVTKSATKKTTKVATGDYFNLSVSNSNNVQIETIVIDYVSSIEGGEGGGDVVDPDPEPDPEEPTPDPEEPVVPEGPVVATIAEFLAAEVSSDVWYELTGVVSNITNTSYGNFNLTDATGTVYVYGLKANETAGKQTFSQIEGIGEGAKIKLRGLRAVYSEKAQVGDAYLVEMIEAAPEVEEPEVELPNVEGTAVNVQLGNGTFEETQITWNEAAFTMEQLKGTSNTAVNSNYIAAPRFYKGHILAIEAKEGYKIVKVSVNYNANYYGKEIVAGVSLDNDGNVVEDTNIFCALSTTSGGTHHFVSERGENVIYIQNTNASLSSNYIQLRPTKIEVTYKEVEQPAVAPTAPVIAIEEGVVTFSCETEGAKIMYAFVENGQELTDAMYQEYTGEISINNGSYTVYAYAVNGTLKSEVVSMRIKVDNGVAVGVEVVAIAEIFVQNRTIVTEGEFQIYTVTGQNVTEMNGNLANGVYVVRSANAVAKVVVR